MARLFLAGVIALAIGFAGAVWYYHPDRLGRARTEAARVDDTTWIDHLYSQNPAEADDAAHVVEALGVSAVPTIKAALENPGTDRERVKAALKACGILGEKAAPLAADVATRLSDPDLTAEAAVALSFMGIRAFAPLRKALAGSDPAVRREALRAIGKLRTRTTIPEDTVLPLLIDGMADEDAGVRAIAATYLGILHEGGGTAVEALMDGLEDEDADVRRSSATALGAFGADAEPALPALRKALRDPDEDVAREAGVAIVKLQEGRSAS